MTTLFNAHSVIRQYSTTWYDPVTRMPARLNEATSCAYLLMRAIDEIEDHPTLNATSKAYLLRGVSARFQTRSRSADFDALFAPYRADLPEVTLRTSEWANLAPSDIAPRVRETFAIMAERMADWALADWDIHVEADLDRYTYAVSGTLVLLLSDLWTWYDGTAANRTYGISYGRALQAINILKDKSEDLGRGVDFWPNGWTRTHLMAYAKRELLLADKYVDTLGSGPAHEFCAGPLRAAWQVLDMQRTPDRSSAESSSWSIPTV
ncbi:squalene/phytoene synthase family protein [Enhygromyxa salina]|uniref:Squalene/phytoene synthase n=1 Tax=Enhygromyxa salina TaxID=215803 RepID=A0A2S9YUY1_9BACT|nr:squalene/phytoene synthase family protein [Enhygromyxa salina]PRQ08896.1 Squalene/phytoene synthase [Enhygromyxa salina]